MIENHALCIFPCKSFFQCVSMLFDTRGDIMRVLYYATMLALVAAGVSCRPREGKEEPFYIGIWQGTYQDTRISIQVSIEFRKDGRAIFVVDQREEVIVAGYSIDLQKQPPHLDIEHRPQAWGIVETLIEQINRNAMRTEFMNERASRPSAFGSDAIVLRRADDHFLPFGAKTAEERDRQLEHALTIDIILFGGKQQKELLAICEVLFRHQFTNNVSAAQQKAAAYFLTIDERDPPAELLDRFAGHSPPVRPRSEFQLGKGLLFNIDTLVWLDEVTVEVEGGYYEGGLSASGNTYVLRRENGTWKVIKKKPGWIA
jgi:hypothetical protein